jgi:hypothetical protein
MDKVVVVPVPLPPEEWLWLQRLRLTTGDDPSKIIASMLRAIRVDDEQAEEDANGGRRH